jgi:hypothetical protein
MSGALATKISLTTLLLAGTAIITFASGPEISDRSPDKKYHLWQEYADKQPYLGDVKLIDAKSKAPVLTLDTQVEPFAKRLWWTKDSQRFAYFNDSARDKGFTRIFFRHDDTFEEVKLPDLPMPPLPLIAAGTDDPQARSRISPVRWTDAGDFVIEVERISEKWGRTAIEATISFDPQLHAAVAETRPEQPSIIDYFLLLPPDTTEGPPAGWFHLMRANGNTIDKTNGYMSCPGDGAQPEFEVALFRFRDGRPLLAYCSGELEGADAVILSFFELGSDGKMHLRKGWPFPVPDGGYDPEVGWTTKAKWEFKLPRTGKTIAIRSQKNHKTLYKLTWNGEHFEREN